MPRTAFAIALTVAAILATGVASPSGHRAERAVAMPQDGSAVEWVAAARIAAAPVGGISLVDVWGGSTRAIVGEGLIGFVAGDHYVEAVDLAADPPRLVGRTLVDAPISAIAAGSGRLYVGSGRTLTVFDAHRPERLGKIGQFALPAPAQGTLREWIAYIAPGEHAIWLAIATQMPFTLPTYELVALDVAEPERTRPVGSLAVDPPRAVVGLWVVADRLVVATTTTGGGIPFESYVGAADVQLPGAPRWIGESEPFNTFRGVAMRGATLYLAVGRSPQLPERSTEQATGVRVIDVAAASGPALVGRWDGPAEVFGIQVVGDVALVGVGSGTGCSVAVLDVRTATPVEQHRRPCETMPSVLPGAYAYGDRLLAAKNAHDGAARGVGPARWEAWAASGTDLAWLARGDDARGAFATATDGRRLLAFDGVDVSLVVPSGGRRSARTIAANLGHTFPFLALLDTRLALSSAFALVAGGAGMLVVDAAAAEPATVGELRWTDLQASGSLYCEGAVLFGDLAVLDLSAPGFEFVLLDMHEPSRPTRLPTPWDELAVTGLAVDGDRLYVLEGPRLRIFTPGGPHGVSLVGEWTPDELNDSSTVIGARGDRLALGGIQLMQILDVSDPAAVRLLVTDRHYDVWAIDLVGSDVVALASRFDLARVESGLHYLSGVDGSRIDWLAVAPSTGALSVIGDRVYVAAGDAGLLSLAPWRLPDGWRAAYRLALPWLSP